LLVATICEVNRDRKNKRYILSFEFDIKSLKNLIRKGYDLVILRQKNVAKI